MTMTNLDTSAEIHALVVAVMVMVMVMVIGHSSNYLTSFAVIRGFLCDSHVVRVAFEDARVGDADELGFLQIVDGA